MRDLLPQAAWWMGEEAFSAVPRDVSPAGSRLFASSGVAVMQAGETQVVVDAGPFGPGRARRPVRLDRRTGDRALGLGFR